MRSAAGTGPPDFDDRHDIWLVLTAVLYTPVHILLVVSMNLGGALLLSMITGFVPTLIQRTKRRRFHTVTLGLYLAWMAVLATVAVMTQSEVWATC